MKINNAVWFFIVIFVIHYSTMAQHKTPEPRAKKVPHPLSIHGDTRVDDYYWLNQREDPAVIRYLNDENAYLEKGLSHIKDFRTSLFEEMKGRIKEEDQSVPYKLNGYWYLTQYKKGQEYPIHSRKKGSIEAEEELLFDVNKMAKGYSYFNLGGIAISPNNKLASFATDTVSRRIYTIRFKNLETGEILKDVIRNTTGGTTWAKDNKTIFYTQKDETLRAYRIYKHVLGTDQKEDQLVYEESDDTFSCYVSKSKSRDYIFIGSYSTVSSEIRYIPADEPNATFKVIQERERDLEYEVEHFGEHFYIRTNKDNAINFKLARTPISKTTQENWEDILPHRENVFLEGVEIFKEYLVSEERENGLNRIHVKRWDGSESYTIPMPEETYATGIGSNLEFDTKEMRYYYSSLTTPGSVMEYDLEEKTSKTLKQQTVLGDFDKENYTAKRLWATARDGQKIAISLVYKNTTKLNDKTPLLLYGYGSYGATIDPTFSSTRLSLLDRGFVFAIAHIRGSQYLGRNWYEDGKLLNKKNTFYDFIDCGKHLIEKGYTSSEHLYASGGSAGGLLMGAVINYEPSLFNGVVAAVPFVDVVTTMLDDSIPLTTGEYDEWGNPNDEMFYEYMKSYSPYDNIGPYNYPHLLITTGLHDSQVQYWEPAKWIAKLREKRTNNNALYLYTDMDSGHGGASGRFESLKDVALDYAFLLDLEKIKN